MTSPRSAPNPLAAAQHLDERLWAGRVMLATVVGISGDLVNVQRNGPGVDAKYYARLEGSWTTVAGDIVLMIDSTGDGGWVVVGKIGGHVV